MGISLPRVRKDCGLRTSTVGRRSTGLFGRTVIAYRTGRFLGGTWRSHSVEPVSPRPDLSCLKFRKISLIMPEFVRMLIDCHVRVKLFLGFCGLLVVGRFFGSRQTLPFFANALRNVGKRQCERFQVLSNFCTARLSAIPSQVHCFSLCEKRTYADGGLSGVFGSGYELSAAIRCHGHILWDDAYIFSSPFAVQIQLRLLLDRSHG